MYCRLYDFVRRSFKKNAVRLKLHQIYVYIYIFFSAVFGYWLHLQLVMQIEYHFTIKYTIYNIHNTISIVQKYIHQKNRQSLCALLFLFLKNVLTDFEKSEWCAAFLDSCASDKRNNQIQYKLIKNYYKI